MKTLEGITKLSQSSGMRFVQKRYVTQKHMSVREFVDKSLEDTRLSVWYWKLSPGDYQATCQTHSQLERRSRECGERSFDFGANSRRQSQRRSRSTNKSRERSNWARGHWYARGRCRNSSRETQGTLRRTWVRSNIVLPPSLCRCGLSTLPFCEVCVTGNLPIGLVGIDMREDVVEIARTKLDAFCVELECVPEILVCLQTSKLISLRFYIEVYARSLWSVWWETLKGINANEDSIFPLWSTLWGSDCQMIFAYSFSNRKQRFMVRFMLQT